MTLPGWLRPYVLGHAQVSRSLALACPLPNLEFLDVLAPQSVHFFRLLNVANAHAFGDMGMPAWVQLDCCTLPSAMVGFCANREHVEGALWNALVERVGRSFGEDARLALQDYAGPVPLSEYCGVPTWEDGTIVGLSFFSLLKGMGLGVRTKALALRCYGSRSQLGITQYTNSALRSHVALGPLVIQAPQAWTHSRPQDTFVYRLAIPQPAVLDTLIRDGLQPSSATPPCDLEVLAEPGRTAAAVAQLMEQHGPLAVVAPGLVVRGNQSFVCLSKVV